MAKKKKTAEVEIMGINFSPKTINRVRTLFMKLAHPKKIQILKAIAEAPPKTGVCVKDIFNSPGMKLKQSHTSIMLGELRKEKLVISKQSGSHQFYFINPKNIELAKAICVLAEKLD